MMAHRHTRLHWEVKTRPSFAGRIRDIDMAGGSEFHHTKSYGLSLVCRGHSHMRCARVSSASSHLHIGECSGSIVCLCEAVMTAPDHIFRRMAASYGARSCIVFSHDGPSTFHIPSKLAWPPGLQDRELLVLNCTHKTLS